jgi:putative transposase
MRKCVFLNNEIYHVYNRGVEKRDIFLDDGDRLRFIHDMFEFNNTEPAKDFINKREGEAELGSSASRVVLVEILSFFLMPNHFNLIFRQKIENGITKFMHKLGSGYTNYFNLKYDRSGHLFQGSFKAIHVTKDTHLSYLPHYIHLNPLDLSMPEWRDQKISDPNKALEFLKLYKWSSFSDYIGEKKYPYVVKPDFILETYFEGKSENYYRAMEKWIGDFDLLELGSAMLE